MAAPPGVGARCPGTRATAAGATAPSQDAPELRGESGTVRAWPSSASPVGGQFHFMVGWGPPIQEGTERSRWPKGTQSSSSASQEQGQLVILFFLLPAFSDQHDL